MSIALVSAIYDLPNRGYNLSMAQGSILIYLGYRTDDRRPDPRCWPGLATIANAINATERTVRTALADLAERYPNLLSIETGHGKYRWTNTYRFGPDLISLIPEPQPENFSNTQPENFSGCIPKKSINEKREEPQPLPVAQAQSPEDTAPAPETPVQTSPAPIEQASAPQAPEPTPAQPAAEATTIPDTLPANDPVRAWCRDNTPALDLDHVFAKFANWSLAHGKRYADWRAGFRLWCQRERPTATTPNPGPGQPDANEAFAIVIGNRPGIPAPAIVLRALAISKTHGRDQHWYRTQPERVGRPAWTSIYTEALKAERRGDPMPETRPRPTTIAPAVKPRAIADHVSAYISELRAATRRRR